jgi:hypothetical protein
LFGSPYPLALISPAMDTFGLLKRQPSRLKFLAAM